MIRVALVDDHAVVRAGYRRLIECEPDMRVVAEYADAQAAYLALQGGATVVDVLVLDLSMPGRSGLDLLRRATSHWPTLRVLVFTMHDSAAMVVRALNAGAAGFVTKSSEPAVLVDAVRRVVAGERALSPDARAALAAQGDTLPPHLQLGAREFDVLHLLLEGHPVEAIARRLHLSPKTVANHQTAIRHKLGVGSAIELLRYARQHGLLVD